jgi:Arc/MetJ-type ribon-helix-helix transcriptional regulator
MANALLGVRLPPPLSEQVETISKAEGYTSTQEFVREALRDRVKEYYRQQALRELDRLAGSLKGKRVKALSRAQRDKIALAITGKR